MRNIALILAALTAISHASATEVDPNEMIESQSKAVEHPDFANLSIQDRLKLMCSNESSFGDITEGSCNSGKPGCDEWKNGENAKSDWKPAPKIKRRMNGSHAFRGRGRGRRRGPPRYRSYADYSAPDSYKGNDRDLSKGNFDKLVNEFNNQKIVFDKDTYESRIHSEADLMISLEAFKKEVTEV